MRAALHDVCFLRRGPWTAGGRPSPPGVCQRAEGSDGRESRPLSRPSHLASDCLAKHDVNKHNCGAQVPAGVV